MPDLVNERESLLFHPELVNATVGAVWTYSSRSRGGQWEPLGPAYYRSIVAVSPSSGGTVVMGVEDRALYVNAGPLAALTVRLPSDPPDGVTVELCFAAPVTVLSILDAGGGAIAGSPVNGYGPGAAVFMRYVEGPGWVYWK